MSPLAALPAEGTEVKLLSYRQIWNWTALSCLIPGDPCRLTCLYFSRIISLMTPMAP